MCRAVRNRQCTKPTPSVVALCAQLAPNFSTLMSHESEKRKRHLSRAQESHHGSKAVISLVEIDESHKSIIFSLVLFEPFLFYINIFSPYL